MNVGHFTFSIISIVLNLSYTAYYKYLPADSLTISLIEVKGDISNNAHGLLFEAINEAGPVPIDLPNNIIYDSLIP